jgi:hypothetical protein
MTPQALFGADLRPEGRDARQTPWGEPGYAGHCYVVATAAVYAAFHPEVIRSVFLSHEGDLRRSPGGSPAARYFVRDKRTDAFKSGAPAIYDGRAPVRVETGEVAIGKLVNPQKIWSQMLDYTYTKFRNQQGGAVLSDNPELDRTGYNRTANGGYANHVMQALTGRPAETLYVDPRHEDELWNKLVDAQAKNKVVVVGSVVASGLQARVKEEIEDGRRDRRSLRMGFDQKRWVDEHAYSAWGDRDHPFVFERNGERMIRLRNPYGTNPPGGRGEDGVGEITFKDFVTRFDRAWVGATDIAL